MVGAACALKNLVTFQVTRTIPTQFQIFKTWQAQAGLFDIDVITN